MHTFSPSMLEFPRLNSIVILLIPSDYWEKPKIARNIPHKWRQMINVNWLKMTPVVTAPAISIHSLIDNILPSPSKDTYAHMWELHPMPTFYWAAQYHRPFHCQYRPHQFNYAAHALALLNCPPFSFTEVSIFLHLLNALRNTQLSPVNHTYHTRTFWFVGASGQCHPEWRKLGWPKRQKTQY